MLLNTLGLATAARPERRGSARRKVESLIYLMILPGNGGILHDLAEDGMCISMANPLGAESDCPFSIIRQNLPPIQGVGRVAWLSKSGKVAGLRFVELSDEWRREIRHWVESGVGNLDSIESGSGAGKREAVDLNTAPPAEEAASPFRAETRTMAKMDTPLYFLPQRRGDDVPRADAPAEEATPAPAAERSGGIQEVRFALKEPPSRGKKSADLLFTALVVCMATIALAGGFLLIYKGEDALQYVKAHAPISTTFHPMTTVESTSSRRARAAGASRQPQASPRDPALDGPHPATPTIWKAPTEKAPFQLEVTDAFDRHWLITASGQRALSTNRRGATGSAEAPGNGDRAPKSETIATPKLGNQKDAPFTVVVDALIGKDGSVKDVRLVHSPSAALAWAVIEAVKQWHYPPFQQDGQPAEVVTRITVAFQGSPSKK
jgi:TonB family protein